MENYSGNLGVAVQSPYVIVIVLENWLCELWFLSSTHRRIIGSTAVHKS
jgi:hypothetical protein